MGSITFLGQRRPGGTLESIQVRSAGQNASLLELIERQGLCHRRNCRAGICGSCAVKVAVLNRKGRSPGILLGQAERETLFKSGRLTRQQYASPILADHTPVWRLACQYVVGEEEILVAL